MNLFAEDRRCAAFTRWFEKMIGYAKFGHSKDTLFVPLVELEATASFSAIAVGCSTFNSVEREGVGGAST